MLCYLKELARLDHLGALDYRIYAFILGDGAFASGKAPRVWSASGEVFGAGGNKKDVDRSDVRLNYC